MYLRFMQEAAKTYSYHDGTVAVLRPVVRLNADRTRPLTRPFVRSWIELHDLQQTKTEGTFFAETAMENTCSELHKR